MKSFIAKRVNSILVNLRYLRFKLLKYKENNKNICNTFDHNFKNIPLYIMRKVSSERYYLYYTMVPLLLKFQKWRLTRFAIKLFIFWYTYTLNKPAAHSEEKENLHSSCSGGRISESKTTLSTPFSFLRICPQHFFTIYRVAPPPPKKKKKKKKPGIVDFLGLCSDQQLSFFTLLDRPSFPHYNNTKIIKFG